jgi:hypothetical protein
VGGSRGEKKLESDESEEPLLLRGAGASVGGAGGPPGGGGGGGGHQGHGGSPKQQLPYQHVQRSSSSFEPLLPLASPFVVRR